MGANPDRITQLNCCGTTENNVLGKTESETINSLTAHEELRCDGHRLRFADSDAESLTVNLRVKEPHQLVYLARLIAALGYEEIHFRGAYLWITTWGVWNPQQEAIAFKTLEQFRRGFGENRPLQAAPGNYFRHDEFVESVCCLLQPMIIGWDAYYVPWWAYGRLDYFAFVSHDSFVDIHVRAKEMHDKVNEILVAHEWISELANANRNLTFFLRLPYRCT